MKPFELNDDALRKGWGGIGQYWFSLKDYTIKDVAELAHLEKPEHISQSAYFVSIGYIPYFVVSDEEVMHSYVDTLTNQKLKAALSKIDEDDYVESFWKYFNVYPQLSEGWQEFEDAYVLKKAQTWCQENAIEYTVNA